MRDSRGFTLIELLLVLLIIGILSAISMANYRQARLRGAETAAIGALTAINQAQFSYMQTCGNQKFAPRLTSLGKPNPATTAPYLSPDLTGADEIVKSGYRIAMEGTEVADPVLTCTGETPVESYHVTADPVTPGFTGRRFLQPTSTWWSTRIRKPSLTRCPTAGRRRSGRRLVASSARFIE